MQNISKLLPFTYGISAARQIMINGKSIGAASKDLLMCFSEGMVFIAIGWIAFKYIEVKVKNSGSLDRF